MLRKEFEARRPAHVPAAPTHASLMAIRDAKNAAPSPAPGGGAGDSGDAVLAETIR